MTFIRCLLTICSNPFSCPIRACKASTVLFVLAINLIVPTAARANVILVTNTQPGINSDGLCSLQEAIYSANFDNNGLGRGGRTGVVGGIGIRHQVPDQGAAALAPWMP